MQQSTGNKGRHHEEGVGAGPWGSSTVGCQTPALLARHKQRHCEAGATESRAHCIQMPNTDGNPTYNSTGHCALRHDQLRQANHARLMCAAWTQSLLAHGTVIAQLTN